ncbi:SGNH/GDSL hydrolase family protein [Dactylosporangium sp. McL0621]|uniref:SGNH/GDSL hydrolase family protein n=1 Tax=Dactylosporangium sp. McL0621 TaxID=3415678 RepID=UPI003CF11E59
MLPSHPRRRWRPAFTAAVSAAVLAAVAGCAGGSSRPGAEAGPGAVGAGAAATGTGSSGPAASAAVRAGPSAAVKAGASPSIGPADEAAGDLPSQVHVGGRVEVSGGSMRYSWPGVYFEGRFRGTGVGIVLIDSAADYEVQVDGVSVATLVTPGKTTRWVNGLSNAGHTVRLVKRNDSPWSTSEFGGFVAAPGGAILTRPAARSRQMEFIGDSLTVGYGNLSTSRDCTGSQVSRTTNTDVSYGALTARRFSADYQINAISGRGMVRNYNGGDPDTDYRTSYDRALLNVAGDVWNPGTWRPQLVVVYLGTNDFSTAVNPGEKWTADSLVTAYRNAYTGFLQKLRTRYGAGTTIVTVGAGSFANYVQQVVQQRNAAGDNRVRYWPLDGSGLDSSGCDYHFSAHDDRLIADRLSTFIGGLGLAW